jgi:hypothetical protein
MPRPLTRRSGLVSSSSREHLVEFIEQLGPLLAEKLMRRAKSAPLAERRVIETVRPNAA